MSMIGKTLANYEITSLLGKGGMGEVYQAKDTKLGREVALKVLPEEFAQAPDRVARFQREAKLLASLNHPNIAAIHGLEDSDGTHFLVMELIEGDTLADRIKRGPIPVEESMKLAIQIAEALEAAHEKGVIHRDLKPANIKITPEGKVKVLDFGLAKAYVGGEAASDLSNSPTLSDIATRQGVILGTSAYMSPEQATGKSVDKRVDIWAFGVVLFEMLTGKKLFDGETVTETLADVIKGEPDWSTVPPSLPPRIRLLLERCLEKIPRNRCSGISDARVDIQKVLSDPGGVTASPSATVTASGKSKPAVTYLAAAVVVSAIIVGVVIWHLKSPAPPEPGRVFRLNYILPDEQKFNIQFPMLGHTLAVSPDGRRFVYSTDKGLYLRYGNDLDAGLIRGTEDENPQSPFFSPDGKWIGFWSQANARLKKISVNGGSPVTLCDVTWIYGAAWYPDNTIVYSNIPSGIYRISANGGKPVLLVDSPAISPRVLPGGKSLLFTSVASEPYTIIAQSLETGEKKELFAGFDASYLPTGHLIYGLQDNGTVFAVPFDPKTLEVRGGPVPVQEGVMLFAISESGTLAYIPGTGTRMERTLVWVDRDGNEKPLNAPPHTYTVPEISPDGKKVAVAAEIDDNMDVWIWDMERESLTRLTFNEEADLQPIWTLDGERIVFMSWRGGTLGIYSKAANGTGAVEKISSVEGLHLLPWSWSRDGKTLIIGEMSTDFLNVDIAALSMEGDHERKPLLHEKYVENHPQVSPDGRWMAYFSAESGTWEIYVRPFPDVDQGKWQVSTGGGESPRWSPDGRELFYITQTGDAVMGVQVETTPTFSAGKPRELFRGSFIAGYQESPPYDIHPDGERFLMIKPPKLVNGDAGEAVSNEINIVLNWLEELKQRVPID